MKVRMNNSVFRHIAILLAFILSGCATPNLDRAYSTKETSNNGVIIASLTKTGHGHWPPGYNFKNIDGSNKGILKFDQDMFDRITSDYSGLDGKLIVLELPAGEYQIYRWFISQGYIGLESVDGFDIRFTVEPGKAFYIGELNNDRDAGGLLGMGLGRMSFNVKDGRGRDLKVVEKLYPNLASTDIQTNLMSVVSLGRK